PIEVDVRVRRRARHVEPVEVAVDDREIELRGERLDLLVAIEPRLELARRRASVSASRVAVVALLADAEDHAVAAERVAETARAGGLFLALVAAVEGEVLV